MRIEEKNQIKEEYKRLKKLYGILKEDLTKVPSESRESYEMRSNMMVLAMRMREIRKQLIDAKFSRFYPTTILENFIMGEEEQVRGGRR